METFIFWLGVVMSIILFLNKLFLLEDKKLGWGAGILGTSLAIPYLFLIHLQIMAFAEIGLLILMLYGFFVNTTKIPERFEIAVNVLTICTILFLTFSTFSGLIGITQCITSIFLLVGIWCMSHKRKPAAWTFLLCCHLGTAYAVYLGAQEQHFFGDFQIASALVSIVALTKKWV